MTAPKTPAEIIADGLLEVKAEMNALIEQQAAEIERLRALVAAYARPLSPEGERTKVEEWEACYALLYRQMNKAFARLLEAGKGGA